MKNYFIYSVSIASACLSLPQHLHHVIVMTMIPERRRRKILTMIRQVVTMKMKMKTEH